MIKFHLYNVSHVNNLVHNKLQILCRHVKDKCYHLLLTLQLVHCLAIWVKESLEIPYQKDKY